MALTFDPIDNKRGIEVITALSALATLIVALRIYTRLRQPSAKLWWDDYLVVIDLPILWAQTALTTYFWSMQLKRTSTELTDADVVLALKLLFTYYHLFNWGISLAKLSALFFYVRIFSISPLTSLAIKILGAIVLLWAIAFSVSSFAECVPLVKVWDPWVEGRCFDIRSWWMANSVSDVVIDVAVLVLPMPMLWGMRLGLGRKVRVSVVFLVGYSLTVASIRRTISFAQFKHQEVSFGKGRMDISHNIFPPKYSFWPIYETPWGIISVCLPHIFSFANLIRRYGARDVFSLKTLRPQPPSHERSTVAVNTTISDRSVYNIEELELSKSSKIEESQCGRSSMSVDHNVRHDRIHTCV